MPPKHLREHYHLSLSIGKALWDDLVGAALPVKVAEGQFDLGKLAYQGVKQLQVKEKVVALIEDSHPPAAVIAAKDRAAELWRGRREQVYHLVQEVVRIEGDWKVQIDREGSDFHYAPQKIGVDAHARVLVNGRVHLMRNNMELPFTLEKRLGAACHLGEIHYDKDQRAVVGKVMDPSIDLGEHVILRLLKQGADKLLLQQAEKWSSVPILKKDQLEEMVAPAGGPLKLKMGIDDVEIEVTEDDLTLRVRFGFTQLQLTGS